MLKRVSSSFSRLHYQPLLAYTQRTSNLFTTTTTLQQRNFALGVAQKPTIIGGENDPIEAEIFEQNDDTIQETAHTVRSFARPNLFAVIQVGGKQYKVAKGDVISVEKIDAEVDEKIKLQKVCAQHHLHCFLTFFFTF